MQNRVSTSISRQDTGQWNAFQLVVKQTAIRQFRAASDL